MYHSRLHFGNGIAHLSLDSLTGEVLEYSKENGENILKNAFFQSPQPFTLSLREGEETALLHVPSGRQVLQNPFLQCDISCKETEDGPVVTVSYPYLMKNDLPVALPFSYSVAFKGEEMHWTCSFENPSEGCITKLRFPVLGGIWLGRDYRKNVLYYPRFAGERYANPSEYLSAAPQLIHWHWQEYRYHYLNRGVNQNPELKEYGLQGTSMTYPSPLSMSWMGLDGEESGFYFGCEDEKDGTCSLQAGSAGENLPGVSLACAFDLRIGSGGKYISPRVVTWLHDGDWHQSAKHYHAFRAPLLPAKKPAPYWLGDGVGLFAHYDFKYQNGGIVHRYCDIPTLAKEAKAEGFNHILLSGWHKDGFDCGFPMYVYDEELGSEEELIEGIRRAKEMGIHTTFYMNLRLHGRAYFADRVDEGAVMREDGSICIETYGNPDLKFSPMCPCSDYWQETICEAVRRGTEIYGADGIYFDQLATGICHCFNPAHNHAFDDWHKGYEVILKRVTERFRATKGYELCVMGEFTCDRFGRYADLQLNQTFYNHHAGGYLDFYRYSFPDEGVTDMVYPTKNMAMRPMHVAADAAEMMGIVFCNGSYFWAYDLEEDNTFKRDPEGFALLRKLVALSQKRAKLLPDSLFVDEDGLSYAADGVRIKRFSSENGTLLSLFALEEGGDVQLSLQECSGNGVFFDGEGGETVFFWENGNLTLPKKCGIFFFKK